MSSLVKLPPKYKHIGYVQGQPLPQPTMDNMGARIEGKAELLGKSAEEQEGPLEEVKLGQVVKFTPRFPVHSGKYTILVGYNKKLTELGAINCPAVCGSGSEIQLVLKAYKNFNLKDLPFIFQVYVID